MSDCNLSLEKVYSGTEIVLEFSTKLFFYLGSFGPCNRLLRVLKRKILQKKVMMKIFRDYIVFKKKEKPVSDLEGSPLHTVRRGDIQAS